MPSSTPTISSLFFFFNDTATTEIYTLSLHDALPICQLAAQVLADQRGLPAALFLVGGRHQRGHGRSEEHTSELQSHSDLVCRLLLEKKKNKRMVSSRRHYCLQYNQEPDH